MRQRIRLFETSAPHDGNDAVILTNSNKNSCATRGIERVIVLTHREALRLSVAKIHPVHTLWTSSHTPCPSGCANGKCHAIPQKNKRNSAPTVSITDVMASLLPARLPMNLRGL